MGLEKTSSMQYGGKGIKRLDHLLLTILLMDKFPTSPFKILKHTVPKLHKICRSTDLEPLKL